MPWRDAPIVDPSKEPQQARRPAWADAPPVENGQASAQEGRASNSTMRGLADIVGSPSDWGRAAALTGRGVVEGLASTAGIVTDPLIYGYNKLTGSELPSTASAYSQTMTDLGVPEPETTAEKFNVGVSNLATGMAAGSGLTRAAMARMGSVPGTPPPRTAPPTSEQLRRSAEKAYKSADDAGVIISPQSFGRIAKNIADDVAERGIDPTLHPRATAALQRLTSAADEPLSLKQAETLRKVLRHASSSADDSERMLAQRMISQLDDYVLNMGADDIVSGDASAGTAALREARNLWSRAAKASEVEDLLERAGTRAGQFSGSGFENAIRTEFRQLVMNPKRLRLFNPAEQKALKRVAQGGPIGNTLRMLGKLAPTGAVSGAISGGAGYAVGGPAGAMALPLGGAVARKGAELSTMRNARMAGELMRRGTPPPSVGSRATPGLVGAVSGASGSIKDAATSPRERDQQLPQPSR